VIVVSDTSAIANLIMVGQVHLLPALFGRVIIPDVVYQELLANGVNHPVTQTVQNVNWLEIQSVNDTQQVIQLERDLKLDSGEANAIVLALELQATQLLMDERKGRNEAKRLGLKITGILGILLAAKQGGLIISVQPVMDGLIAQANFRVSPALYAEVLKLATE
jgi:uncharacterized protein